MNGPGSAIRWLRVQVGGGRGGGGGGGGLGWKPLEFSSCHLISLFKASPFFKIFLL